jgi:hypothetical protein
MESDHGSLSPPAHLGGAPRCPMLRFFQSFLLLVMLAGCRTSVQEGLKPLPEGGPPLTFVEMVARSRAQAGAALDSFYIDAWFEVEVAGQRLEQTARLLPKAAEIPEALKTKIDAEADALRQDAGKLVEAARAKNAQQANEAMQRINLRIRQLNAAVRPAIEK